MGSFFINFFTVLLLLLGALIVLVVLQQRPSANAGMGAALGGGMAESAFGGEASAKLSKFTIILGVLFFITSFGLALARMGQASSSSGKVEGSLPEIKESAEKPKKAVSLTGQAVEEKSVESKKIEPKAEEKTMAAAEPMVFKLDTPESGNEDSGDDSEDEMAAKEEKAQVADDGKISLNLPESK